MCAHKLSCLDVDICGSQVSAPFISVNFDVFLSPSLKYLCLDESLHKFLSYPAAQKIWTFPHKAQCESSISLLDGKRYIS